MSVPPSAAPIVGASVGLTIDVSTAAVASSPAPIPVDTPITLSMQVTDESNKLVDRTLTLARHRGGPPALVGSEGRRYRSNGRGAGASSRRA
jgi:hypothetical protein